MQSANDFLSIYFCGSEDCTPGHSFGPAVRPHYLLHIVRSGKGRFHRGDDVYTLREGDAFLIVPLESTFYQADEEEPWAYTWIGFDGPGVEALFSSTCFSNGCIFSCDMAAPQKEAYFSALNRLFETWQSAGTGSFSVLGQFLEVLDFMRTEPAAPANGYADLYLQKAREYIDNNYSYPIRVTDIAQTVGIDRTYLYRLFMEKEGISPKQYLLRLRLRTALKLLRSTTYSITEIAFYCGFNDSTTLCNQFKAHFQETPGAFRRRNRFQ